MYISLVFIFGILAACLAANVPEIFHAEADHETKEITITKSDSETESDFDESLENVTIHNYLYGEETDKNYVGITATPISTFDTAYYQNQTSTSSYANQNLPTTTEEELLYLVYDYDWMDRETFWKNNTHECINGTWQPSSYLRMKYSQCEKIHAPFNPQCTKNCEMAITNVVSDQLGPLKIPTLELFKNYTEMTLPEDLHEAAYQHYTDCFEKFGDTDDLLDIACKKSQPFFTCINEFQSQMNCTDYDEPKFSNPS